MRHDLELIGIAQRHHHLLTERQALRVVGRDAWRRAQEQGRWLPIVPTVFRHAATPLTFEMSARATNLWLGGTGVLFGASALHWLGVEVPAPSLAEFIVPRSARWIPPWSTLHTTTRWDMLDVSRHRGVHTSTAARAIIDYGMVERSASRLEAAIDSAIKLRRTALPRLRGRLADLSGSGRHGCPLLRELLLDSGGESVLERRFLRLVRTNGLPRPQCQVVFRRDATTVARVDFLFPNTNIVVEVSGRLGHSSDADRRRDARRRNELQQRGYIVLEFTTVDVIDHPDHVLATLRRQLCVMR